MPPGSSSGRPTASDRQRVAKQQELASEHMPLVREVLFTLWHLADVRHLGQDEATSVGYLALVQASHCWHVDGGACFRTYACIVIERAILAAAWSEHGVIRAPRWLAALPSDDPRRMQVEKTRRVCALITVGLNHTGEHLLWSRDPEKDLDSEDAPHSHYHLRKALRELTFKERSALRLVIEKGESLRQTARLLGVTRQRIRQLVDRAIEKLQARLEPSPPG